MRAERRCKPRDPRAIPPPPDTKKPRLPDAREARLRVGQTSRSVLEGLRPAEFHEKRVWWQNGKAARRGRQGSGEVEAVGLFDPEHARFERIIGRRSSPLGAAIAT